MFAFAFYEKSSDKTYLARDPFGMKPLFYSMDQETLNFCSEFLPLQKMLGTDLSKSAFYDYLQLGSSIGSESLDQKIFQVLPGQILIYDKGKIQLQDYLSLKEILRSESKLSFSKSWDQTCLRHMISDVDVGLMLSGGMDSTSIALSLKNSGTKKLDCYSLAFSDQAFDESHQAKELAKHLGFQHYSVDFPKRDFIDHLGEALSHLDGPFGDASFIPTYFLCKEITKDKKVVLSGDGGDEVFFGYPTFMASRVQNSLPLFLQKLLARSFQNIKVDTQSRVNFLEKLQRFSWGMGHSSSTRHLAYMNSINPSEFREYFEKSSQKLLSSFDLSEKDQDWYSAFVYYFRQYLANQVLMKTDRASMACSLEVRCPFLDIDFIENNFSYPSKYFPVFESNKQVIKNYLKQNLPKPLLHFQKKGFSAPLHHILPSLKALVERKHGLNLNCRQ
ncbi:asparagine synthase-related protein, partial [bacterium]|nr:asparagine synthase-related protein [bacterium]